MPGEKNVKDDVKRGLFQEGDMVLLIDRKERRNLITLRRGDTFHSHTGTLSHDALIDQPQGTWARTSGGQRLLAVKPTLADFVLEMPRRTQVVYPKDLGVILLLGDIFPGARVLEAGLGSGALTIALLRGVGVTGEVISYEVRAEQVEQGMANVKRFFPEVDNLTVKVGDIYQGIEERDLDRIVLDVPEPWHVVPWAASALVPGGILLSFLPTTLQLHQLAEAFMEDGRFHMVETVEVLLRPWHVSQRSVRPAHRMVAHTGFITTARLCLPHRSSEPAEIQLQEEET
jgi:tRNA (adenine57-N1/adenine58-N1)-methyltransferase